MLNEQWPEEHAQGLQRYPASLSQLDQEDSLLASVATLNRHDTSQSSLQMLKDARKKSLTHQIQGPLYQRSQLRQVKELEAVQTAHKIFASRFRNEHKVESRVLKDLEELTRKQFLTNPSLSPPKKPRVDLQEMVRYAK